MRVLQKTALNWSLVQRKWILKQGGFKLKLNFDRKVRLSEKPLEEDLGFCFDRADFPHKISPRPIAWRKVEHRVNFDFTRKGIQEDAGGNAAHFMVAIWNGNGVVWPEQYHDKINA